MSRLDEVKEFIGYIKLLVALVLATLIGLIGWLTTSYQTISHLLLISSVVGIVLLFAIFILLNAKILKDIKSLKDL